MVATGFDWYVINALSGYEGSVAKAVRDEAEKKGLADSFLDIIVPTESYVELKRGKKVELQRKVLPGYVLVKMQMNEATWGLVKRVPNVARFLGADSKPAKISEHEVQRILKKVESNKAVIDIEPMLYEIHEAVRIKDGPFETFTGVIEEIDAARGRLKVLVSILGREAPVELEFKQVEKI